MKPLIQCANICKSFGSRTLLENISLCINEGQHIGLIGCNGAGKTTFANILTGRERADSGSIVPSNHLRISYLEQHSQHLPGESVIDYLVRRTGKEPWQCAKMAHQFQLDDTLCAQPVESLSGGYRTRVNLAAALLHDPNLLVLDEPTNYLDLATLVLLEQFLATFEASSLIISHDRTFLRNTCDHILELEHGDAIMFPGSIDEFLIYKEEQTLHKERHNKNVEAKRRQLQGFVDKFRSKSSKARQAQSIIKQINRLEELKPEKVLKTAKIVIPPIIPKKGAAFDCEGLTIGYPDKTIAKNINSTIMRGAHVAIIGNNGEGKTTFLKTLAGELPPLAGTRKRNGELDIGYFAQHVYSELNPDETIYEYLLKKSADGVTEQEVRNIAGGFLFHGKDIDKPIGVLSGGERARVCLAGLLLGKKDILLLDEPTNHLDVQTVEALAHALQEFNGTVIVVSHDRGFVKEVATDIIEVADGKVKPYSGTYDDYLYQLEHMATEEEPARKSPVKQENAQSTHSKETRLKIRALEKEIAKLEKKKARYLEQFAVADSYDEAMHREYLELVDSLEEKEAEWLELND